MCRKERAEIVLYTCTVAQEANAYPRDGLYSACAIHKSTRDEYIYVCWYACTRVYIYTHAEGNSSFRGA